MISEVMIHEIARTRNIFQLEKEDFKTHRNGHRSHPKEIGNARARVRERGEASM